MAPCSALPALWQVGPQITHGGQDVGVSGHHYSCLENPRDREAWWVAIYGAAQSRTWLMQLSSSMIPSAQRFVWAAKQALGKAALGTLFA